MSVVRKSAKKSIYKSFACHSYANTRDGGITPPQFLSPLASLPLSLTTFRINTCISVASKQLHPPLESTLMKKPGGGGPLWLTSCYNFAPIACYARHCSYHRRNRPGSCFPGRRAALRSRDAIAVPDRARGGNRQPPPTLRPAHLAQLRGDRGGSQQALHRGSRAAPRPFRQRRKSGEPRAQGRRHRLFRARRFVRNHLPLLGRNRRRFAEPPADPHRAHHRGLLGRLLGQRRQPGQARSTPSRHSAAPFAAPARRSARQD